MTSARAPTAGRSSKKPLPNPRIWAAPEGARQAVGERDRRAHRRVGPAGVREVRDRGDEPRHAVHRDEGAGEQQLRDEQDGNRARRLVDASGPGGDREPERHGDPGDQHGQAGEGQHRRGGHVERLQDDHDPDHQQHLHRAERAEHHGLGQDVGVEAQADVELPLQDPALLDDLAAGRGDPEPDAPGHDEEDELDGVGRLAVQTAQGVTLEEHADEQADHRRLPDQDGEGPPVPPERPHVATDEHAQLEAERPDRRAPGPGRSPPPPRPPRCRARRPPAPRSPGTRAPRPASRRPPAPRPAAPLRCRTARGSRSRG